MDKFKYQKFEGLVAAAFTPFNEQGDLNPDIIPGYYEFLQRNKVSGVFINGSTGEFASLTENEKQVITSKWGECQRNDGKVRIINLVGGTSYKDCIHNAILSRDCGLSAIAILEPYYFRPDEERLVEYVTLIAEAVPDMPVYFYHVPFYTRVTLPMISLLKKLSKRVPNFAGLKISNQDLADFGKCIEYEDFRYDILWGIDESIVSAFQTGCRGVIGSTYNFAAPLYEELIQKMENDDLESAGDLLEKLSGMAQLNNLYGPVNAGKAFMRYAGLDCGDVRLPLKKFSPEEYVAFADKVKDLGLDQYISKF